MKTTALALLLSCAACAAEAPPPPAAPAPAPPPAMPAAEPPPALVRGQPFVELRSPGKAVVDGQEIAFDGIEEGLVWPALDKAVPDETYPGAVVLEIDRGESMQDVLRAVFTLREADLRLQAKDETGARRFVTVAAKKRHPARQGACRLAVFRRADGSLRVAAPGGPRELAAPNASDALVSALEATKDACPIRYVAFGTMDPALAFGPLFDVMLAVDRAKAAGDARYVLAEPVAPPR